MKIKEPIIHIGFPKCASSFLQQEIFPKLNYQIKNSFLYANLGTLYLDDIKDKKILNLPYEKNYILSLETFLHIDIPMAWKEYGKRMSKDIFISNIKEFFNDRGKILIIIRRQDTLIESWVKSYTPFNKGEHFFVDYPVISKNFKEGHLKNQLGFTYTHTFDYYDILSRICAGIDRSRVYILIYEDLKYNPEKFYKELGECVDEDLSRFISNKKKVNVSHFDLITRRLFIKRYLLPDFVWRAVLKIPSPIKLFFKRMILKEKIDYNFRKDIMQLYKKSNERLAKKFNLDLKRYYYY